MDQREYAILSSILRARLANQGAVKLLVIARDAIIPFFVMPERMREKVRSAIAESFDDFSDEAFDAFTSVNENGNDIGDAFDAELPITILSRAEIDGFFGHTNPRKAPGWPAFYERFPDSGGTDEPLPCGI